MNSKKSYFIMIGLVAVFAGLFGFLIYQTNLLIHKENDKLLTLKLEDKILDKQQDGLEKAKEDILKYSELEEISKSIIPEDKDQANTIGEITTLANRAGIPLGVIQFPQSNLGKPQKNKKTVNTDSSKSQLVEVPDLKGVYSMSIEVSNHSKIPVEYDQIIDFLKQLESSRRTAQVTDISIRPDSEHKELFHFTIMLNTYMRPAQ